MTHNLLHIDGKPFVLVPLHEYRELTGMGKQSGDLPPEVLDALAAGADHPLKIIRRHRSMTQDDLAAASGISRPYIAEIETGRKDGSVKALRVLSRTLKVDMGLLALRRR